MRISQRMKTDVLVIGAGSAGIRAALAAAEAGSEVLLVNRGPVGKSGITLVAAGGMQIPLHPEDSAAQYFADTVRCGYSLGDQNLIRVLAEEAVDRVKDLERYGVQFVRNKKTNEYSLAQSPGQSNPRTIFVKGGGVGLVSCLLAAARRSERITIIDDFFVSGLVKGSDPKETVVAGAIGLDLRNGALTLIHAKAVVMATGGCQWLWEVNDCPCDATGDGLIHAYRVGADLTDMEMILFYPSVIIWPPSLQGTFVHYEFLDERILGGNIYDKDGCAVLPKPLPVRDQAMRLMAKAIYEGRDGLVWYVGDSPKDSAVIQKVLNTSQYNYIRAHGIEPSTDKIKVAPGAHYLMGGIYINEECKTSVKGLFATPECAGNFDGANRLAGNGLTATQVFGAKAGLCAHKWAVSAQFSATDPVAIEGEIERIAKRIEKTTYRETKVIALREQLRSAVQLYAGVIRSAEGLTRLRGIIRQICIELDNEKVPETDSYNQQLVDVLQLENMCEIAGLIAESALLRCESRGHHFRSDFPEKNNNIWCKHTLACRKEFSSRVTDKAVITIP